MKLSELVAYRNRLSQFNIKSMCNQVEQELSKVTHEVNLQNSNEGNVVQELNQDLGTIFEAFNTFELTLIKHLNDINAEIERKEKSYFVESYRLYDEEMCHETTEWILNRRMPMSIDTEQLITSRIKSYCDWHYPAMIIRPGLENFISHMVGFDPVYIIDQSYDLLTPSMKNFPPEYQKRLRPYTVTEKDNELLLKAVPDGQFGFCLAFNFFEFKPFEILRKYLEEIYLKLRPGGVLAMTFNDCDRSHCVALVEANFTCYTPGAMVRTLAKTIGYTEVSHWNDNGNLTWLELRKPGQLESLRGGQTLAKVVRK